MQTRSSLSDCGFNDELEVITFIEVNGMSRDKQHWMNLVSVGGLYAPRDLVRAVLAPEQGLQKRVLDLGPSGLLSSSQSLMSRVLGCGSATWLVVLSPNQDHVPYLAHDCRPLSMAREFPHAEVVGVVSSCAHIRETQRDRGLFHRISLPLRFRTTRPQTSGSNLTTSA